MTPILAGKSTNDSSASRSFRRHAERDHRCPMIDEGQVHGGLAQGIGQSLLEHAVYDSNGQPVTASFMDYTMPRADDLPSFKLSHTTTLCPRNPLGIKGCGEAGAISASPQPSRLDSYVA